MQWHRGSTAHVSCVYPWAVHGRLVQRGPLIGVDRLAGDGPFVWDPFEAYAEGLVTNPNVAIFGEPGSRKSTLVKTFLWRMFTLYGDQRWVGIADPKGEYVPLAEKLGLTVVRLSPGGSTRVNPLAPGPSARYEDPATIAQHRSDTMRNLLASVLGRDLVPAEKTILSSAITAAMTGRAKEPTLADLANLLVNPTEAMTADAVLTVDQTREAARDLYFGLADLLNQSLRGMFDGPGTVRLDAGGRGLVIDLSGLSIKSPAMKLVLMTSAAWLQEFMVCPGPQRVNLTEEGFVGAGDPHFVRHMQVVQKLGRGFGCANVQVAHKPSDLPGQAADGSAESKIAAGLLSDAGTRIVLRQAPDQVVTDRDGRRLSPAQKAFGLTDRETAWVGQLAPGRALWLIGQRRALVQHHLAPSERELVDTDGRMRDAGHAPPGAERAAPHVTEPDPTPEPKLPPPATWPAMVTDAPAPHSAEVA